MLNLQTKSRWVCKRLRLRSIALVGLLTLLASIASAEEIAELAPGLAREAPASGRSVRVDGLYMVPYRQQIPGTDAFIEMVPISGGKFLLGSPDEEAGRTPDEGPRVLVVMEPYWMGKYEVTWSAYRRFMGLYEIFKRFSSKGVRTVTDANRVDAITAPTPLYDPSFTFSLGDEPNQPAVTMSQYAARQFTKWISGTTGQFYRLPTEAEWEYACRAGAETAFCYGDDPKLLETYAWYYENSEEQYHTVGQKQPNAWGLYDMHGNVAEMVLDQFDPKSYERLAALTTSPTAVEAIQWPTRVFGRVTRGGGWGDDPEKQRCAARGQTADWRTDDPNIPKSPWWLTDEDAQSVGFRVARPYGPPAPTEREQYWGPDHDDMKLDIQFRLNEGRGVEGLVDPGLPAAASDKK